MQKFATHKQPHPPQSDASPGNDRKKNRIKRSDNHPTEKRKVERRQNEKDITKIEESEIGSPSLIIPFKSLKKQNQDKMLILGTPDSN